MKYYKAIFLVAKKIENKNLNETNKLKSFEKH